ncbi:MAG: universal stress protein [Firmicutes bacterium]|nr:universal stress protein [Bacillota bacterium]
MTQLRLVLASDGSPGALAAARWIRDHCAHESVVYVVTVAEGVVEVDAPTFSALPEYAESMDNAAESRARQAIAATARVLDGFPVHPTILNGSGVGDTLLRFLETVPADALVVGRRGSSWVRQMTMGSVSQFLAQRSPVPLWIIP